MNILPEWLKNLILFLGSDSVASYFENMGKVLDVALQLAGVIAAVFGLSFIRDIRRKQKESVFSFLSQLRIRLEYVYDIFKNHETLVIDALDQAPENDFDEDEAQKQQIKHLSEWCSSTLAFLRDADNQYPAGKGWSACMKELVALLSEYENAASPDYYLWPDGTASSKKREYYTKHIANLRSMLNMIDDLQCSMENVIFHD